MSEIELLKINDFKNKEPENSFYANTITNHLLLHHSRIEKPHKHNFYAVFLFTKGTGIHEIDFNKYEVKPGSVFFLYPGQTHSWELSDDIDGYIFFHTEDFYEMTYANNSIKDFPFFESNYSDKCIYLSEDKCRLIEDLFKTLLDESAKEEWKKKQLILSYLTQIYIYLNRFLEIQSVVNFSDLRHYQSVFSKFEKLVDEHFTKIKSATEYADLLNITQKHLNRIVKSITQKTTTKIITDRIVLEAKRQLLYTNKTLNEIAFDLGFTDYTYFSRLFKKQVAITASDFRKMYKNER